MPSSRVAKLYFPHLNTLRFIAVSLVFVHHTEQLKEVCGLHNNFHYPVIQLMSKIGVCLFFVLSGFLITMLLLSEEKQFGKIAVRKFYIRRILRIWPLYYLLLLLAFLILPHLNFFNIPNYGLSHFYIKLAGFMLLVPNIIQALGGGLAYANQLWSVGTEEQFYLVWPLLLRHFRNRLALTAGVVLLFIGLRWLGWYFHAYPLGMYLFKILNLLMIDCMATGALFAVLYNSKISAATSIIERPATQIAAWALFILLILSGKSLGFLHFNIYAMLFGIIIYNLSLNPKTWIKLQTRPTDYLGKISYGIYIYHPIAIVASIKMLQHFNSNNSLLIYIIATVATIGISSLSYHYFEQWFLRKKTQFTLVHSGK